MAPGSGFGDDRRFGTTPPSAARRSSMYWISGASAGVVVRRLLDLLVGDRQLEPSRKFFSSSAVSFFAWWVMLRPAIPGPSVQPFTVLARITVGAPLCATAVA